MALNRLETLKEPRPLLDDAGAPADQIHVALTEPERLSDAHPGVGEEQVDHSVRRVAKLVRDRLPKLKTQIQGDAVRVTGKSKDELQAAIQLLRTAEIERKWPVPLQFNNYR